MTSEPSDEPRPTATASGASGVLAEDPPVRPAGAGGEPVVDHRPGPEEPADVDPRDLHEPITDEPGAPDPRDLHEPITDEPAPGEATDDDARVLDEVPLGEPGPAGPVAAATTPEVAAPDAPEPDALAPSAPAPAAPAARTAPDASAPAAVAPPAPEPDDPAAAPHVSHVAPPALGRHRRRPVAIGVLSALLVASLAIASYLYVATTAYEQRADEWEDVARDTGEDLARERVTLEGTTAELAAVREQLTTAQTRITELADEKAQLGDDAAAQRQLSDYQARVSEAAGTVASALNQCVDGQNRLIGYLENADAYDPGELARFRAEVDALCQSATDANIALQQELSR